MNAALALVVRDLRLALRTPAETLTILAFFVIAATLFAFGIGPEPQALARVATGIVWVVALLACLISLDRLFQSEADDGSLDQLVLAPASLELLVLAKCLAQWLTTALPLIVVSPIVATMLQLPAQGYATLLLTLLLGTPSLSLFGAIGAALSVGARKGGALLALIVLPLYIPVLIFAVAAVEAQIAGLSPRPHLFLLAGFGVFALTITPFAAAAALRQASE
ncbi:MAG: heme exporter protein CcmB [Alphaproteobacteria bacterium]|nr:heme exporter protein CcmB [Alphaproteobacteria bacterium]